MAPPQPGGESGYEPFYPTNVPIPSSVKQFISSFFEISDDPDATDAWVRSFQDGATVVMGNETARGTKGQWAARCEPDVNLESDD